MAFRAPVDSSDEEELPLACVPPVTVHTQVRVGITVHIPYSIFPEEEEPELGYWIGTTVYTSAGGQLDIGILVHHG